MRKKQIMSAVQVLGVIAISASFVVGLWAFSEHKLVIWIIAIVGFALIEVGRRMKKPVAPAAKSNSYGPRQ